MGTLEDIAESKTSLLPAEIRHLRALTATWQIVADLSFCDLVLWLDDSEAKGRWAAAQVRPTTGPTALDEDVVGEFRARPDPDSDAAAATDRRSGVEFGDRRIAVLERRRPVADRWPGLGSAGSALEEAYSQTGELLVQMIAGGEFPGSGPGRLADATHSMRVGDGFVRLDARGRVSYASPNALSAYRRLGLLGDLLGADLVAVTRGLVGRQPTDQAFSTGDDALAELEARGAVVQMLGIALRLGGVDHGHMVLLRDVTDLRLRERELVSKDATIREIHHRVKNNLQTVAALLRLQGRRMENPEARDALREAEQRVGSIALVHETLSQSFDDNVEFDEIADTLLRTIPEMGALAGVRAVRVGSFGILPGETATTLALVLTELVQNAVEHAFGPAEPDAGRITVAVNRIRGLLKIRVSDNGRGLPDDFDPSRSLGLSIVSALVDSELRGSLEFGAGRPGGAAVTITLQV